MIANDCPLPPGSRVVAYFRDSGGEDQERSVEQQHREAQAYCARFHLVLVRVFGEHFRFSKAKVAVKANHELSASSLQSPDDLEATYREKGGKGHQGYAVNVAESCDPKNAVQLITKVQVAPNTADDAQLLAEAAPGLKELNIGHSIISRSIFVGLAAAVKELLDIIGG